MKAITIAIFTAALCLAAGAADAKGRGKAKAHAASAFKGSKTASGYAFPSKAPKASKSDR